MEFNTLEYFLVKITVTALCLRFILFVTISVNKSSGVVARKTVAILDLEPTYPLIFLSFLSTMDRTPQCEFGAPKGSRLDPQKY